MADSTLRRRASGASGTLRNDNIAATTAVAGASSPQSMKPTNAGSSSAGAMTTSADRDSTPGKEFEGAVAATFLASKGTDLLRFARRKVEEQDVRTAVIESEDGLYNILLMRLPYERMLTVAEELALRKRDLDGTVRTFRADDVNMFTTSPTADALFSQSEQILLLEYQLAGIKPDANFDDVVANESILEWCKRQHYLDDIFPLHHTASAAAIMAEITWRTPLFDVGGITKVQDYFGDKVALYFAFLGFYTKALFWYGGTGLIVFIFSQLFSFTAPLLLFVYSIFAALWGAAFVSLWKRRNIEIVYMWTSLIMGDSTDESLMSMTKKEDLRRKFSGIDVSHRITGEKITIFPKRQKLVRLGLSVVVVLFSLLVSSRLMLAALDFEDIMDFWIKNRAHLYRWSSPYIVRTYVLKNVPTGVYLACLYFLETSYNLVARKLTENENHKYNADFENSLVFKLVLFQFLNLNMAYLHVAFIRRDYFRLAKSIRTVLLVELIVGNVKENIIPMFMTRRKRKARLAEALRKKREANPDMDETECDVSVSDLNPITVQLDMEPYDGVFNDYFELVRQFSQISLFAAAFPLGAMLALLNNFFEVYTDAHKLVHQTRRASPQRALNIGAWIRAFEFLSVVSIMTNLGIITVTASFADKVLGSSLSKSDENFWMVVVEHVLVVSRFAFATLFEGIPSWVRDQRAKERFLASKSIRTGPNTANGRLEGSTTS